MRFDVINSNVVKSVEVSAISNLRKRVSLKNSAVRRFGEFHRIKVTFLDGTVVTCKCVGEYWEEAHTCGIDADIKEGYYLQIHAQRRK